MVEDIEDYSKIPKESLERYLIGIVDRHRETIEFSTTLATE